MNRHVAVFALTALMTQVVIGCGDEAPKKLAPSAEGSSLAASKPKSQSAKKFAVDPSQSKVEFAMDAPREKIRGRVPSGVTGEIFVDPADLSQTTGNVAVDISLLELFQRKADESDQFGEESKNELQNKHARSWLEIDDTTPADVRTKNSRVEFAIRSIVSVSAKDVTKMTGDRKVTAVASGDFLLHGRQLSKQVELEITFKFDGDKPVSMTIKSVKPMPIGLAEFDVRPREAFGKLAEKTLELLAPKVAKEAPIMLEIVAVMGDAPPPAASAAPSASAAPEPSASAATSASAAPQGSAAPSATAAASAPPAGSAAPKKGPAKP